MTREEVISILSRPITMKNTPKDILEAHKIAIKTLERQLCDDCISREEAIRTFADDDYTVNELRNLPSVTPQPRMGEWLKNGDFCKCSNCHSNVLFSAIKHYNFCPNCGAKMEVGV